MLCVSACVIVFLVRVCVCLLWEWWSERGSERGRIGAERENRDYTWTVGYWVWFARAGGLDMAGVRERER